MDVLLDWHIERLLESSDNDKKVQKMFGTTVMKSLYVMDVFVCACRYEESWVLLHRRTKDCAQNAEVCVDHFTTLSNVSLSND